MNLIKWVVKQGGVTKHLEKAGAQPIVINVYQEKTLASVDITSHIDTPITPKSRKILKASHTEEIVNQPLNNKIG